MKKRLLEGLLVIALLFVVVTAVVNVTQKQSHESEKKVTEVSEGWYYFEDGVRTDVTLPAVIRMSEGQELVLYHDGICNEYSGQTLTTKGAEYGLIIEVQGEVLYRYADQFFPRNAQMKAKLDCDAILPVNCQEGTVALHYTNAKRGIYHISGIYVADGANVRSYHYASASVTFLIAFIMIFMGILVLGVSAYLFYIRMFDRRFVDVALFLFICAVWCITDASVMQQNSRIAPVICTVSFYAFMLLSIPMLHFVKSTGELKKYGILDVFVYLFYANAIAQGILNYLGIFEYIQMLFVTHLLLASGVASVSILLIQEYKTHKNQEIRIILSGFVTLGASGVLAMLLYWILRIKRYEILFEIGILLFVFLLLAGITITMVANVKFKTEMLAYQRLSMEDRLTGLGNRRAFDAFIGSFHERTREYQNAVLMFFSLDKLREINEYYGQNAGNEMILSAARCIDTVFKEAGKCFRIAGDEYCVILEKAMKSVEEYLEELDHEISEFNKNNRFRISLSRGWSCLQDEDGNMKTISDWKYEADRNLYRDRGEKRK